MKLAHTIDEDPGIIHTNLALLPPLIADNPGDPPNIQSLEEARAREAAIQLMEDSTVYPVAEGPNPHEPIILSELFALTDSLWTRFPLQHAAVRAHEIMASQSAIFTYSDLEEELVKTGVTKESDSPMTNVQVIATWVSDGPFNEADVVIVPAPDDSEDEELPSLPTPAIRKTFKSKHIQLSRSLAGRTSLAIFVLVLGLSIAAYQARTKRGLSGLWAFPGLLLDAGTKALRHSRAGTVGSWLVSGKIKLEEIAADVKQHAQSLIR